MFQRRNKGRHCVLVNSITSLLHVGLNYCTSTVMIRKRGSICLALLSSVTLFLFDSIIHCDGKRLSRNASPQTNWAVCLG
jgi:hypothetical protein